MRAVIIEPIAYLSLVLKEEVADKPVVFLRQSVSVDTVRSKKQLDCRHLLLQNREEVCNGFINNPQGVH